MRDILLDISRPLDRALAGRLPTGVDRVSLAYIRHFAAEARALVYFKKRVWIFPKSVSQILFSWLLDLPSNFGWRLLGLLLLRGATTWFPRLRPNALLLNVGHSNLEHPSYLHAIQRHGFRLLYFVHDLIPISHPEYCRPGYAELHSTRIRNALKIAAALIANSKVTLDALAQFSASLDLPLPPAVCAPLSPFHQKTAELPSSFPIPSAPYFLMVGTVEPRKNYTLILQLWRSLAARLGPATPKLVLVGQRGWECENTVDLLERSPLLQDVVIEHQRCSDVDLAALRRQARALLFPSFVEGYGLPLAEALEAGVPVIASDLPVFREFAADIPEYIDPLDGRRWAEVLSDFTAPNSPMRAAQLLRLSSFRPYSWNSHFETLESLFSQIHPTSP